MSWYYTIFQSTTHNTEDCKLIDQIHDAIDLGICQTILARSSKDDDHHYEGRMEEVFTEDFFVAVTTEEDEVSSCK